MNATAPAFERQLKAVPFFEDVPEPQLALLAKASTEKCYEKDRFIFRRGDSPTGLFVLTEGTIKLACQSWKGEEKVLDILTAGQVFGEAALLLGSPYPYLASAITPARLLHVERGALLELVDASPKLRLRLASHLASATVALMRDIEHQRSFSTHERVARFLLDQGGAAEQAQPVALPTPRRDFASRLGMTPESLSRAIRELVEAGVIEARKRTIWIIDGKRLAAFAG